MVVLFATGMGYVCRLIVLQSFTQHILNMHVIGIPLPFVAIGLGVFHDEYGVKDTSGELL